MDKERVIRKLDEMDMYLEELKEIIPTKFEDYERDKKTKRAVERLIHIIIESTIDVCSILVRDLRLGVPENEDDFFDKLRDKVLTSAMSARLKEIKGFRNVLVHRYGGIDDSKVFRFITTELVDFYEFKEQVRRFLKSCTS